MIINSLVFPDEIKNAIKNERLVVFVGAGVSRGEPTCLPDFSELVYYSGIDNTNALITNESIILIKITLNFA